MPDFLSGQITCGEMLLNVSLFSQTARQSALGDVEGDFAGAAAAFSSSTLSQNCSVANDERRFPRIPIK